MIQGLVIGRLTSYYTERTLLMLGVVVFGGVGLALVRVKMRFSKMPEEDKSIHHVGGITSTTAAA